MSARRRRVGSESEQVPLIVTTDSYDKHEGKLKNYSNTYNQQPSNNNFPNKSIIQDIDIMAARDRTKEFSKAIQSLQSRQITRAVNVRDPKRSMYIQGHAEFMMIARTIGKNIASTYAKLEKLTLCKF